MAFGGMSVGCRSLSTPSAARPVNVPSTIMRFIAQKPIPVVHDRIRLGIVSPINGQQITVLFKIPPIIEREQLLGEGMPIGQYISIIHGDFMPPYLAPGGSTQNNGGVNIEAYSGV